MNGWFAQNVDYLVFLVLVAALWTGLGLWLHRSGRFATVPRITWLLLAATAVGGWFVVNRAGDNAQRHIRQQVELLLPFYVQELQQMGHARLPDNPAPDDPLYLRLIDAELRWLRHNPAIADIYTFRRRADGAIFLLVDSETDYDHNGRYEGEREQRTIPGEIYTEITPSLERAFRGESSFDDDIVTDRWGTWVSANGPLRDAAGNVEAVLGVDFDASLWLEQRAQARLVWLWCLGGVVLLVSGPAVVIALQRHELKERQETERQLRAQSELRRKIFDQAPGGVALADLDFRLLRVNDALCRMLRYSREELLQMTFVQITHPEDVDKTVASNRQVATGQAGSTLLEKRYIRKDGTILDATVLVGLVRDEAGTPEYMVGQITDISDRRQAESELLTRQKQLAAILSHVPIILYAVNAQGIYTLAEGAGLATLGRRPGEAVGQSIFDRYAARPDILSDIRRALAGETFSRQLDLNGTILESWGTPQREADGRISGMIGIAIDITDHTRAHRERDQIERKLLEVQKLESLGILAGGVAHDFNNLLTAILGNANLARLALGREAPALSHLAAIEQASQLAAGLCQQLLAYAGRSRLDTQELDVSALVRDTTDLLRLSVGNNARLQLTLASHLPGIMADPAQIRQILLNIVLNAAEAVNRRDGVIAVTTRRFTVDAAWLAAASIGQDLPPGDYVGLEITDNGPGLDAGARARVFDPFFSTKGSGRGLGLAATLGIMRSHRGALHLASEPGQGARFTLAFPPLGRSAPAGTRAAAGRNWRGSGNVLIVDDEEAVRATAAQMIAYFGFTVRQAGSGPEALEILRQNGCHFDLVLLDLTMPDMDGYATFTAIRRLRPEQRIVVFSGYSASDAQRRFASENLNGFLQKPFSADSLREVLSQVAPK